MTAEGRSTEAGKVESPISAESLAHDRSGKIVCRGQLKDQGGGARRGQLRHGEAMS
jgi:hypothetical protein